MRCFDAGLRKTLIKPAPAISAFSTQGEGWQGFQQGAGDFARIAFHGPRQLHRQVAGVVAMLRLLGALEHDARIDCIGSHNAQRLAKEIGKVLFQVVRSENTLKPLILTRMFHEFT